MFEAIIKRGTLMTVIILIVSVLGVMAALRIPVQMIPDLEVRTITVRTSWPGATPQDIEKEIVIEQEEYLRSTPGLQRIISSSLLRPRFHRTRVPVRHRPQRNPDQR